MKVKVESDLPTSVNARAKRRPQTLACLVEIPIEDRLTRERSGGEPDASMIRNTANLVPMELTLKLLEAGISCGLLSKHLSDDAANVASAGVELIGRLFNNKVDT